jgi:hypothetical protein
VTALDAIARADWLTRYALDRLPDEHRRLHPGVRSHLTAASVQLRAVIDLAQPTNDRAAA